MRLTNLFEYQIRNRGVRLIEHDQIALGMSRYDVDLDTDGDRIHLRVLQNGMDIGEVVYEDGEVVWIHVEPFFRKQGLGSAMVQYLQDRGYPVVMPDARTGDGKAFFGKLDQRGKLDEITLAGSFDDDQSGEFRRYDPTKSTHRGDTSVGSIMSEQDITDVGPKQFFFTDNDGDPIGYAYTQFGTAGTINYAKTTMIWITEEYRGRGIAGDFYEFLLLTVGRTLMSDNEHSAESYQVWWKLVQKYTASDQNMTLINTEDQFDDMYDGTGVILVHPQLRKTAVSRSSVYESLKSVPTYSPDEIAKKHGVSVKQINAQLAKGIKVEREHTTNTAEAREIALDHLLELPDYYDRLARAENTRVSESGQDGMFEKLYAAIYRDRTFAKETSTPIDQFIEVIEDDYEEILWWNPDTPNVIETDEFWDGFRVWLKKRYDYVIRNLQHDIKGYPLKVVRAMTVTASWNPKTHGVGLYWAIPGSDIHAFSGKEGPGYQEIDLTAVVKETDINWFDTLRSRMDFMTGDEEGEIQLQAGIPIRVVEIGGGRPAYGNKQPVSISVPAGMYLTSTGAATFENHMIEAARPWLRITPTMIAQAKGMKCQVIVEIPIEEFLQMTTGTAEHRDQIKQTAHPITSYNKWAKMGHNNDFAKRVNDRNRAAWSDDQGEFQKEYGSIIMPFLSIQLDDDGLSGRIYGHEGRHRAASALRAGNTTIPVALCMKPGRNMFPDHAFGAEYQITQEHIPHFVTGQMNGNRYTTRGWKVIDGDMQKNVRRN